MVVRAIAVASLVLVLAACSGSAGLSPSSGASAPVRPSDAQSFSPEPSAAVEMPPLRLLVLGDSIAIPEMGCGACVGFDRQYASYVERQTGRPVELDNQARPNAQIADLRRLLDSDTGIRAAVAAADIVVVSIGYNDTPPWPSDMPCHTPEAQKDADLWAGILAMTPECIDATVAIYQERLDAVYARIEALTAGRQQVRVTLGSFDNLRDNPGGDGTIKDVETAVMAAGYPIFASVMDAWNEADCAAASAHGFVCGDIHHAFNGPDGMGSIKGLVNPADFVHPSEAGQAVIAQLLERVDLSTVTGR